MSDPSLDGAPSPHDIEELRRQYAIKLAAANDGPREIRETAGDRYAEMSLVESNAYREWRDAASQLASAQRAFEAAKVRFHEALTTLSNIVAPVK